MSLEDGLLFRHVDQFAGDLVNFEELINTSRTYLESKDKWSSRPEKVLKWPEIEKNQESTMIKRCEGYHFEFGTEKTAAMDTFPEIVELDRNTAYYATQLATKC